MTTTTKKKTADTTEKTVSGTNGPKTNVEETPVKQTVTVENEMKTGIESAAKGYEQIFTFSQAQAEKVMTTFYKQYEDAAAISKETAELATKSGNSFSTSYQQFSTLFTDMAQTAIKKNMAVAEAFLAAKDINEVSDIQSKYARESFDALVKNGTEITELTTKVATEVAEPIRQQMTQTFEKMSKTAA
ncbi:phasin family protein [Kiloniella laminariae]|uniref:Phasin family protein n=1 Tax=Kiloniella laminariae TaxID=454162 RepID=A0ABT4LE87_9PROT|nr:phasin family protein [Kiloniella laminariae]MCZ4279410.1 phasin family protein [Kiloniella laminariae]